jgi:hypothetical protein
MRNTAGIEWDLVMQPGGVALVIDAVTVTFGIVNNLRAEREVIPAWWAAFEREYKSRKDRTARKEPKP